MTKKEVKDLKVGDYLYFLDTNNHFVSVNKVTNIEEYPYDYDDKYLKITWEKEDYEYSPFPNFCVVKENDTSFWEEPDYDSDGYNEDDEEEYEDEERLVFVNREDLISRVKGEIERLQKEIDELP